MTSTTSKRPPLPAGRPSFTKEKSEGSTISHTDYGYNHYDEPSDSASHADSTTSRTGLRQSLLQRREYLTIRESAFLEHLIETGDEIEVAIAHATLLDEELFFASGGPEEAGPDPNEGGALPEGDDGDDDEEEDDHDFDGSAAFRSARTSSRTSSSSAYTKSMSSFDMLAAQEGILSERPRAASITSSLRPDPCPTTEALGSDRRREHLQLRRQSQVYGQIWQAHENGLAVTQKSSRRAMVARSKSLQQIKTPSHRGDDIFRARRRSSARRLAPLGNRNMKGGKVLMDDVKSDNNRTRPRLQPPPKRPSLRRLSSDVSRKSVSFAAVPPPPSSGLANRAVSDTVLGALPPRPKAMERESSDFSRQSQSSIPSLHMGQPIRSFSIRSDAGKVSLLDGSPLPPRPKAMERGVSDMSQKSTSSVPSLHMAHPIRSFSVRSDAGESLLSDQGEDNAKALTSHPSIHHGRPVRSNSVATSIATYDSSTVDWLEGRDPSDARDEKKEENDSAAIPTKVSIPSTLPSTDLQESTKVLAESDALFLRPVLMRRASVSIDEGEGIEVADFDANLVKEHTSPRAASSSSFANREAWESFSMHECNSFDETMSYGRISGIFRNRATIQRSLSDDDIRGMYLGGTRIAFRDSITSRNMPLVETDEPSWRLDDDEDGLDYYDSWMVIEDEYENGYGGGGTLPFRILGTSATDKSAMPHVLSPPLMESLQAFMPYSKMGENFWLKYSMVRDGASLHSFLRHARGSKYSVMAIETVDGEVFGAFVGEAWRKNWNYYGSGQSFLWRMRHTRHEKTHSIIDQAHMESEIDVYPFTGENRCVQLCTDDNICVGGGSLDPMKSSQSLASDPSVVINDFDWGAGLVIQDDLLQGTSSPCLTFGSPSLSNEHADGSRFEIINMELWTLTPCMTLDEAEKLELGRLFLEKHGRFT
jgi:hypothetical protein